MTTYPALVGMGEMLFETAFAEAGDTDIPKAHSRCRTIKNSGDRFKREAFPLF